MPSPLSSRPSFVWMSFYPIWALPLHSRPPQACERSDPADSGNPCQASPPHWWLPHRSLTLCIRLLSYYGECSHLIQALIPYAGPPHCIDDFLILLRFLYLTPGHLFLRILFSACLDSESLYQDTFMCEFPPHSVWALSLYTKLFSYVMNSSPNFGPEIPLCGTVAYLLHSHQFSAVTD